MESMVNRLVKVKIYKIPLFFCALKRRGLNHTYIYIHIYIFTVCASVSKSIHDQQHRRSPLPLGSSGVLSTG